jgi:hypothetical protein
MPGVAWKNTALRPATVAIHDDRNVTWKFALVDLYQQVWVKHLARSFLRSADPPASKIQRVHVVQEEGIFMRRCLRRV